MLATEKGLTYATYLLSYVHLVLMLQLLLAVKSTTLVIPVLKSQCQILYQVAICIKCSKKFFYSIMPDFQYLIGITA